eukprot:UN02395
MAYKAKKIKKWTTTDLADFVKNVNLPDAIKKTIVGAIESGGITGKEWVKAVKCGTDVKTEFGVSSTILANRIYGDYKKLREEQVKKAAEAAAMKMGDAGDRLPDDEKAQVFDLHIFGQSKYWTIKNKATRNTKVSDVARFYKTASGVGTAVDDIVLIAKTKILPQNDKLGDIQFKNGVIGITDDKHLITVKFKAHGGMSY